MAVDRIKGHCLGNTNFKCENFFMPLITETVSMSESRFT